MTRKGLIFTLDMTLAIIVVVIVIASATYFFAKSSEEFLGSINLGRMGSDVTLMLYKDGTLGTLDRETIATSMNSHLPENYEMRLSLSGDFPGGLLVVESDPETEEGRFKISGVRYIILDYNGVLYNAKGSYEVWVS